MDRMTSEGASRLFAALATLSWFQSGALAMGSVAAEELPKLGAELSATSVSGLSSGAYMAGQIQVAHAKDIIGAGIVAGGPYACAESSASRIFPFWPTAVAQNATQAAYQCMQTTLRTPDGAALAARAKELAEDGKIDPIAGLAADNVYLFSGNEDQTVTRPVVKAAEAFYKEAGVGTGNITLVEGEGGHAFITEQGGAACGISEAPYVSDCDYGQAKALLAWIYGPLQQPSASPGGRFIVFDQTAFSGPGDGLADEGVVYVPDACTSQPGCRVHIALHGCDQSREAVGDTFVKDSGFAEVADTNRMVILFPQVKSSTVNPHGCWDWWGYTGLDYLGADAPQIKAIWAMVEQLTTTP
ncbi:MAG TPA: poly(3-hydroxybutyrate) depolymerase [Methyloceanibacter sp.]|jgi:poly(3-hydroxybutyrate) depolymerase|nr:poly(3-hydroxybutyrate) depolymerase [Methyloceanibacter sp.]